MVDQKENLNADTADRAELHENEPLEEKGKDSPPVSFWGRFWDEVADLAETAIFAVFIVSFLFVFVFRIAVVQGTSMEKTLFDGERLIVSNLFYKPSNSDIVVIDNRNSHRFIDENGDFTMYDTGKVGTFLGLEPDGSERYIVKRVIAVAGQTLNMDFDTGKVYVDGKELADEYVAAENREIRNLGAFEYPITIPEGYVFVMGDHRNVSNDSRAKEIGLISLDDILGRVYLRVMPISKFGVLK